MLQYFCCCYKKKESEKPLLGNMQYKNYISSESPHVKYKFSINSWEDILHKIDKLNKEFQEIKKSIIELKEKTENIPDIIDCSKQISKTKYRDDHQMQVETLVAGYIERNLKNFRKKNYFLYINILNFYHGGFLFENIIKLGYVSIFDYVLNKDYPKYNKLKKYLKCFPEFEHFNIDNRDNPEENEDYTDRDRIADNIIFFISGYFFDEHYFYIIGRDLGIQRLKSYKILNGDIDKNKNAINNLIELYGLDRKKYEEKLEPSKCCNYYEIENLCLDEWIIAVDWMKLYKNFNKYFFKYPFNRKDYFPIVYLIYLFVDIKLKLRATF